MNRTALTVVLVILLLASLGSNTFLYLNKMKSDKELENKVAVMKAKDSLQSELNRMEDSLIWSFKLSKMKIKPWF